MGNNIENKDGQNIYMYLADADAKCKDPRHRNLILKLLQWGDNVVRVFCAQEGMFFRPRRLRF